MKTRASILAAALVLGAAAFTAGCTVYSEPATVETETYTPAYYEGDVVYYDEAGTPFIYTDHEVRYVPRTYAHFDVLLGHYRRHGPAYHAWYRTHRYHERERHEHRHDRR